MKIIIEIHFKKESLSTNHLMQSVYLSNQGSYLLSSHQHMHDHSLIFHTKAENSQGIPHSNLILDWVVL